MRDRLAYAILIIEEAIRNGGNGRVEYDCLFFQQAVPTPSLQWSAAVKLAYTTRPVVSDLNHGSACTHGGIYHLWNNGACIIHSGEQGNYSFEIRRGKSFKQYMNNSL